MHYKSIDYNYIQHYSKLTHFPCPHYCIYRQTHYIIIKKTIAMPCSFRFTSGASHP